MGGQSFYCGPKLSGSLLYAVDQLGALVFCGRAFEVEFPDGATRVGHIGSCMRLLRRRGDVSRGPGFFSCCVPVSYPRGGAREGDGAFTLGRARAPIWSVPGNVAECWASLAGDGVGGGLGRGWS